LQKDGENRNVEGNQTEDDFKEKDGTKRNKLASEETKNKVLG